MSLFCLPKELTGAFKQKLKDGSIDPQKLATMSSQDRRVFFAEFLGEENARQVNRSFEEKLLLKNQQQGFITWAKRTAGLKPEVRKDLVSRIQKMDEALLTPADEQAFLEDLAAYRLGVTVTLEEAANISEMSRVVTEKKDAMAKGGDRMEYGRAVVGLNNYVKGLKEQAEKTTLSDVKASPLGSFWKTVKVAAGTARSLKASLDNSSIFRQGWKTLWTNPGVWSKNAAKTLPDIVKRVGGKSVMNEVNADLVSRPNYDLYRKAKLAVGTIEEEFPTSLPEKIPLFGRLFSASQDAYTGFVHRMRADVFDKYIEVARNTDVELTTEELRSIGKMVNSLTGRGDLGRAEPAADVINSIFFSPRLLKSHFDVLGGHVLSGAGGSSFVKKQAAINMLKIISGTAAVLATANAIDDEAVEWDPRSSDFGKIKVGSTRFEVTGGMASLVTLATRLISGKSKSTTTGTLTELNSGDFGSRTKLDVFYDFFENKTAPVISAVIIPWLEGVNYDGNKPTFQSTLSDLYLPLTIDNYLEMKNDPDSAPVVIGMILEGLGIGANTYSQVNNWNQNPGVELEQFRDKIGQEEFDRANADFNMRVNNWIREVKDNDTYKGLSNEDQKEVISNKKEEIKQDIFKEHGFKPKRAKPRKLPKL